MSVRFRRFALLVVLAGVATVAPSLARTDIVAAAQARLTDLRGVEELRTLFNRDTGKVRLVLLVSPT